MSNPRLMTKRIRHGLRAYLTYDTSPEDPRGYDNTTCIATWHRRYAIGDLQPRANPHEFLLDLLGEYHPELENMDQDQENRFLDTDLKDILERHPYPGYIRPLFMYEHGDTVLSTGPFSCPWDSGWLGWVYITPEKVREHQIRDPEQAERIIQEEIKLTQAYGNGEVYTVEVEDDYQVVEAIGSIYHLEETGLPGQGPAVVLPAPGYPSPGELDELLRDSQYLQPTDLALALAGEWQEGH